MKVSKEQLDEVYKMGRKNGAIEMRNVILKSLNRDYTLLPNFDLLVKLMKKINKLRLPPFKTTD